VLRFTQDQPTRNGGINRREWLRIGGFAGLGLLSAGDLPAASQTPNANGLPGFGRAKSVIVVFAGGGQSQLEMWDPKPDAPLEVRGAFNSIRTSVPGTLLTEHMPCLAKLADRYTIVRSMSHADLDHGTAFYLSMTGRPHRLRSANPPPSSNDLPALGAVLKRVRPEADFPFPALHLNGPAQVPVVLGPGQYGGILGSDYDPMTIGDVTSEAVALPGLSPLPGVPTVRMQSRQRLLDAIDGFGRTAEQASPLGVDLDVNYRRAFDMLATAKTRDAFDLSQEPAALRDRYGRNRSGQACLLARRLVEAGVPLVTVFWNHTNRGQDLKPNETDAYGWDTHNDIFASLRDRLLPRFDLSFSTLLEDLDQRGLLDDTLVICMGEFGRAPLVALEPNFAGATPGRKHWAAVYSIVMAGAGIGRGKLVGKSDRFGGYPASEKYGPQDIAATLFSALGIDPSGHYKDPTNRPWKIAEGKPIGALWSDAS
jgi:hypothetical protein